MNSIVDSVLSMNLDVYRQSEIQDPDTGAIVREWNYYKTVACHVKGVISNSATTRSSDKQIFSNKYLNDQVIQVRTSEKLTAREKITNIRDQKEIQFGMKLIIQMKLQQYLRLWEQLQSQILSEVYCV
jgi:hypothetical protein